MKRLMTRRQVVGGLGALSGMALLAACGGPASTSSGSTTAPTAIATADRANLTGTFNYAAYDEGESRQVATNNFFAQNYPKMTVKYDITPGLDPYFVKMQTQIAGNAPPDYMLMHETRALSYAAQGLLTNLDPYQQSEPMPLPADQYLGAVERQYKGSFYVWPSGFGEYVLVYNKDLFDQAGVTYPEDSYTWQSLVDTAKQFTRLPDTYGFLGFDNLGTLNLWYPTLKAYGGETFDAADSQCVLNTPEAISTFDLIRDAYTSKATPDPASVQTPNASRGMFFAGKGAMIYFLNGQFDLLQQNRQGNFKYGLLSLPAGPKGRFVRFGGSSYAIPKGSKYPQVAWELTRYLLNDENAVKLYTGGLSSRADYFEKYSSPPPDALPMLPNWRQVSIDQGVQYRTFVRYSKIGSQFSPMVYSEAGSLVDGGRSAADVAKSITDKANQMLKDFKG